MRIIRNDDKQKQHESLPFLYLSGRDSKKLLTVYGNHIENKVTPYTIYNFAYEIEIVT